MSLKRFVSEVRHGAIPAVQLRSFPAKTSLANVLNRLEQYDVRIVEPKPARLDEVAEKVTICLTNREVSQLSRRDLNIVPWVMWVRTEAARADWFLDAIFGILSAPDRPVAAIRSLIQAYVAFFNPTESSFSRVGSFLRGRGRLESHAFGRKWLDIDRRFFIFDPSKGPERIAEEALESLNLLEVLNQAGIGQARIGDGLARRSFDAATSSVARRLRLPELDLSTVAAVERLMQWNSQDDARHPRYPASMARMANELLTAIPQGNFSRPIGELYISYFVRLLGDPRLRPGSWQDISASARESMMRLLVGATLEDFFRIVGSAADARMFNDRRDFWLGYHQGGFIDDAWVALGPKATLAAKRLDQHYASLHGASEKSHSAIILRMSNLIIVEWSHNGRCRFFPRDGTSWAPGLYDMVYDFRILHERCQNAISHLPPDGWQRTFANQIFKATGIRHPTYGQGGSYPRRWPS